MLFVKNNEIEGVIFDIDGTIIDSLSLYHSCFNHGLEGVGIQSVPKDILYGYLGMSMSLKDILRKIISDDKDAHVIEKAAEEILDQFKKVDMEIQLLPGVREIFLFLKTEKIRIGLATGRTSSATYERERLKKKGLDGFIDAIVTSAEVENRKPAPDVIIACATKLDVEINKCLAIGDSVSDIHAARSAGAIPVGVSTGIEGSSKLEEHNPEEVLEVIDKLMDLLNRFPEK